MAHIASNDGAREDDDAPGAQGVERVADAPAKGTKRWEVKEHDAVFDTLDRALGTVKFPATKQSLATRAGSIPVEGARDLPLVAYLQALPNREYASPRDVRGTLHDRWHEVKGLRGTGWESE